MAHTPTAAGPRHSGSGCVALVPVWDSVAPASEGRHFRVSYALCMRN
jgi:hypothetical protein